MLRKKSMIMPLAQHTSGVAKKGNPNKTSYSNSCVAIFGKNKFACVLKKIHVAKQTYAFLSKLNAILIHTQTKFIVLFLIILYLLYTLVIFFESYTQF